jgi:N-acetyl-gamma-glutamyl-phosphate reductase
MKSFNVGVIGASGYTGLELLRLLYGHPNVNVAVVTVNTDVGKTIGEIHPSLYKYSLDPLKNFDDCLPELNSCDLVFSALPHGISMQSLGLISTKIIDISSDFRLKSSEQYIEWYGSPHCCEKDLINWSYGLPELFRDDIKKSNKVANPGCFATAIILSLAPILDLIDMNIVVNAISGTSGAGKKLTNELNFSHQNENVVAYKLGKHQHIAEIEQALINFQALKYKSTYLNPLITMSTCLAPMSRGIQVTCSAKLNQTINNDRLKEKFYSFYHNESFVDLVDKSPHTKYVRGSNMVNVYPVINERTNTVLIATVIDNLVKGASGQAVQNANILFGIDERTGLTQGGLYP